MVRFNQVLNHAAMSAIPYMNEIISDSRRYQNITLALHDLTVGNVIRFPPAILKRGGE